MIEEFKVCKFFSGNMDVLKCAINPHLPCDKCKEFECNSDPRSCPLNADEVIFIVNRYPTGIQLVVDNFFQREKCWYTGGFIPKNLVVSLAKDVKDFFVSYSLDAENLDWIEIAGYLFCEFTPSDVDQ